LQATEAVAVGIVQELDQQEHRRDRGDDRAHEHRLLWLYPDGSRILELSTKCKPKEAFDVAAETRAYLSECGVNLEGEQQTKTRTALEYFTGGLGATK
jgi:hypothetical protein